MSPFDYINDITYNKKGIMVDDIAEKDYNAFKRPWLFFLSDLELICLFAKMGWLICLQHKRCEDQLSHIRCGSF